MPELSDPTSVATVRLSTANGEPFRTLRWNAQPRTEFRISGGRIEMRSLPPGSWNVTVSAPDGRVWQGSTVTDPTTAATLVLE